MRYPREQQNGKKHSGGFVAKATGTIFTLGFVTLLNFVVNLVLARVLGPGGKGIIAPAMNVASVAIVLASLGMGNSVAYFLDRKSFHAASVMVTSLVISLISGVVSGFAVFMVTRVVVPELSVLGRFFFAGGTFFTVIYTVTQSNLLGRNRIGLINLGRLAAAVVRTALCIILLYFVWPTAEGFAFAYMGAQAINALLTTAFSFNEVGLEGARLDARFLVTALAFSIAVYLARISIEANASIGIILLKQFRPASEVGYVSQALTVARLLMLIPQALALALYGAVVGEKGKERFAARAVRLSLAAAVVMAGVLAVLAPWLIPFLFKKAFTPSVPYLWGLLPAMVLYVIPQLYTSIVIASWGKPWHFFFASFTGLIVNAAGCLILIPLIGSWGMVIAYSVSIVVISTYYVVLLIRKGGLNPKEIFIPRKDDFKALLKH